MKAVFEFESFFGVRTTVESTPHGTGELLAHLAAIQAIAPEPCGLCGKEEIGLISINGKKGPLIWFVCKACGAQLRIATPQGMHAWKQRTDDEKRKMPNGGWHHYEPNKQYGQSSQSNSAYSAPADPHEAAAATPSGEIPF